MKKAKTINFVIVILIFVFLGLNFVDLDQGYINKFGYNSICVSKNGYPQVDKFDASQFDFRNGKFYVEAKSSFCIRAILPDGKTYRDLLTNFTSTRSDYAPEDALENMVWRIFASHDQNGKKLFENWPPSPSDMNKEVTYMTSDKELAFFTFSLQQGAAALDWKTSGVDWKEDANNLRLLVSRWLDNAKPGWQLYIVHTVGYQEVHRGNERFIVDDPLITAIVEVK